MLQFLQVLSIVLVAVGMGLSLAHALELPGKLRLDGDAYFIVQTIYYPGFTIGGVFGEFGAMVATLVLLVFTPFASTAFWLVLVGFIFLLIMHGIYWTVTHPVNRVWLRDQQLHGAGAAFFAPAVKTNRVSRPIGSGRNCATAGSIRMSRVLPSPC
jgi:hypothetical protein